MNKFKKATKRITAVAGSALMVSSAVFGAGLSDYPNNFVSGGAFNGQVVVGAGADAMDTTSANSIIDDLTSQFSGSSEQVKITYKKSSSGGETVNAVKSTNTLNYGETLGATTESEGFDDGDADVLEDGRFDNDISDEDYEQTLTLYNGSFNHALRDEVDGVTEIADGLFFDSGETFAVYQLDMDTSIDLSGTFGPNLIGHELEIMGNEFTVAAVSDDATDDMDSLTLVGGANKVALGEGESTTITVDGTSYEIEVLSVSTDEVLMTVNGQSVTIDEFDTEEVGGVTIAVTELVDSDRDSVKGYAEIVVGGQKVKLEAGNIEINDEEIDDLYPDYEVDVAFSGSGMKTIDITYKVDDDVLLEAGDSLMDILFNSFELVFEGTNEPDYTWVELTSTKETIDFSGTLETGKEIPSEFQIFYDTEETVSGNTFLGDDDYRIFFPDANLSSTNLAGVSGGLDSNADGVGLFNSSGGQNGNINTLNFTISTDLSDYAFFIFDDNEDQYLYELNSIDTTDAQVDFNELLNGKTNAEQNVELNEWGTELEQSFTTSNTTTNVTFTKDQLGTSSILAFDGELLMDFSNVEDDSLGTTETTPHLTFSLDSSDVDGDDVAEEDDEFNVTLQFPGDSDDPLEMRVTSDDIVNSGSLADKYDDDDDIRELVTEFGLMAIIDNQDYKSVKIGIPDEQVHAKVNLVFGGTGAETSSTTVDADEAAAKVEELEADGYTIVSQETMTSEEVSFDVSAPVLDSDVSGMSDMIVVGGPAVNSVAADLLGLAAGTSGSASGVNEGEAVIRYFESSNSVLVYGWSGSDTAAAADKLNAGGLSGSTVNI